MNRKAPLKWPRRVRKLSNDYLISQQGSEARIEHNIIPMTHPRKVSQLVPSQYSANVVFGRASRDLDHEAIESTSNIQSKIQTCTSDGDGPETPNNHFEKIQA